MRYAVILGVLILSTGFIFCGSIEGDLTAWSKLGIEAPAAGLDRGMYLDVAVNPDNLRAFVAYYDANEGDLRLAEYVASGGNCGSGAWQCTVVDSAGDVGRYPSIDIYSAAQVWKLGIAYEDVDSGDLKFYEHAFSGIPAPGSWTTKTVVVDATPGGELWRGRHASLRYDSGGDANIAAFACADSLNCNLKYSYEKSSGGNCGEGSDAGKWQCENIDSGLNVGRYASLELDDDDIVYIAYFDGGNQNLRVAEAVDVMTGNCGPYSGFQCTTVDSTGDVGRFAALEVSGSGGTKRLDIAYHQKDSSTAGALKFAEYVGSGGNCDSPTWSCWTIDDTSSADDMGLDLVNLDGTLVVGYFDSGGMELGFEEMGGNCGPLKPQDGGGFARSWHCGSLSEGSATTEVGAAAVLAEEGEGEILLVYSQESTLTGNRGIESAFPWITRDNFESGDFSAWSGSAP